MIEAYKFSCILKDLEMMFTPLTDFQRDTYYKHLKYLDESVFQKAINYLMDVHTYRRTPLISEIRDAAKKAQLEQPRATAEELDDNSPCMECGGIGVTLHPVLNLGIEYMTAFPCENCRKGRMYKTAWKNYLTRGKNTFQREEDKR